MRFSGLLLLSLFALLLGLGCQNSDPRIESTDWELFRIRNPQTGEVRERLSLFLAAVDQEGDEDLDQLYLYHPESRLYWSLRGEEWEKREREGRSWIGSSRLAGLESLPRGEYGYILIDRAGGRSEGRIFLDPSLEPAEEEVEFFPSLEREGDTLLLDTDGAAAFLIAESPEGRVLAGYRIPHEQLAVDSLGDPAERSSTDWYLFVYRERFGWYAGSGPYRF